MQVNVSARHGNLQPGDQQLVVEKAEKLRRLFDRVNAIVLPDNLLGISLLGNTFLNRLNRFEVSNNRLVMEN